MNKPLVSALFILLGVHAAEADYRAEAIQTSPNGTEMRALISVSDHAMRNEFQRNGETVVQVFKRDTGQQIQWLPARKTYMQGPVGEPVPRKRTSPCEGVPNASCIEQGRETIAGREAVKWQMTVQAAGGKKLVGTQWLDAARGMPLRMLGPNGETTEARMLGKETMLGREVEKWEFTTRLTSGQTFTGRQWYDPGLDTQLREELPDGSVREFKTLEIKDLPADVFTVPQGFTRIEPSATPAAPAAR